MTGLALWWGCPNSPPCVHAGVHHDVAEAGNARPRCCVDGCGCGARMVIVCARTLPDARVWAQREGLQGGEWRWPHDGQSLRGLPYWTKYVRLPGFERHPRCAEIADALQGFIAVGFATGQR